MATKVLSLLEILASRGGIAKTTTAPSAWAIVAQWKRYFEMKGEEAEGEEKVEESVKAFETQLERTGLAELEDSSLSPIEDPGVVEARKYFVMEYLRNLTPASSSTMGGGPSPSIGASTLEVSEVDLDAQAARIISSPDLRVPAGGEFRNLPQ
eukprot:scaffold16906_cov113-Cylindrotheca_fusiformis.AAC.4